MNEPNTDLAVHEHVGEENKVAGLCVTAALVNLKVYFILFYNYFTGK